MTITLLLLALSACSGGSSDSGGSATSSGPNATPATTTPTTTTPTTPPTTSTPPSTTPPATGTPTLTRTVFHAGLQNPWDMAFTPDGSMLYTERSRGLSVRYPNGTRALIYRPTDLVAEDQSGMLGLALDPQFATNRSIYLYIASNAGGATDTRVIAVTLDAGLTSAGARRDILTGITYAGGAHSGGRIRFGPDGLLYVTTGDTRQGHVPQRLDLLGGKVLRIDRDGNPASGNNPPTGANPRIYAYGFRNPQGIAFRPVAGTPFLSEHGPAYDDEVTPLRAGGNGGWDPLCADNVTYCGYDGVKRMTDTTKFPQAMVPAWKSGSPARGIAGAAFVTGTAWRDWDGALVIAELAARKLSVLRLDTAGTNATETPLLDTLNTRLRSVTLGPDGALYVATDGKAGGDEIWRLAPQ